MLLILSPYQGHAAGSASSITRMSKVTSGTCALVSKTARNWKSVDNLLTICCSCSVHARVLWRIRCGRVEKWAVGLGAMRIETAELLLLRLLWWLLVVCALWMTEFAVGPCASSSKLAIVRPLVSQSKRHLQSVQWGAARVGVVAHRLHESLASGGRHLLSCRLSKRVDIETGVSGIGAVWVVRAECLRVPELAVLSLSAVRPKLATHDSGRFHLDCLTGPFRLDSEHTLRVSGPRCRLTWGILLIVVITTRVVGDRMGSKTPLNVSQSSLPIHGPTIVPIVTSVVVIVAIVP